MRHVLALLLVMFSIKTYSQPFIQFDITNIDIGEVCDGPEQDIYWTFTNISDTIVVIDHANSTGPMLTSEWTLQPIKPEGKGKIHGKLLTTGSAGRSFYRTILVQLTNGSCNTISVKGDIKSCEPAINYPRRKDDEEPQRVGK